MVPDHRSSTDDGTRRDFLRTSAGAMAAGLSTLTAGCASALPPLGSKLRFGRVGVPPADEPKYRRWLPAPAALGSASEYPFLLRHPTALDYPAPVRFVVPRKRLLAELDHFGVGYASHDRLLRTPFGTVLEGGFDPTSVATTLVGTGYRRDGTYADHGVFVRSDVPRRAVVTDEAVVWSSRRVHPRPNVERLVDAREGRITRYHEENDAVERVTETVGESRMVEHVPPTDERTWTSCEGFRFDGDTAYHVRAFLYPEAETLPENELRRRSKTGTVLTREVENTDFRIDGRLVTVEGRIPPGEGIQPSAVEPPYPPQVTWGYSRETDAGAVSIRHEAGDSVAAADLAVSFGIERTGESWSYPTERSLSTALGGVGPGDTVTVDVSDVPDVTVIHPDDVDHEAENPYAAGEPRPATRLDLEFAPGATGRTVFSVDLEAER